MAEEKPVHEQVQELLNRWNPPEEDHALQRLVGSNPPEGDTRATTHVDVEEVNKHIGAKGFRSPTSDKVDASRPSAYADDASEDDGDEYDDMTVAELQEECEDRGLPKSGNKADLQARLREDDAGSGE